MLQHHHRRKKVKYKNQYHKFSVGELQTLDEDDEYDPEIFKYLSELVGDHKQPVPLMHLLQN